MDAELADLERLSKDREQQRIASCLSSPDYQLTANNQKLEAPKTYKKDLVQQLFSSPEEATDL